MIKAGFSCSIKHSTVYITLSCVDILCMCLLIVLCECVYLCKVGLRGGPRGSVSAWTSSPRKLCVLQKPELRPVKTMRENTWDSGTWWLGLPAHSASSMWTFGPRSKASPPLRWLHLSHCSPSSLAQYLPVHRVILFVSDRFVPYLLQPLISYACKVLPSALISRCLTVLHD